MSVTSFLQAIPKVELNVRFEGALPADTLQVIAEQNDIPRKINQYKQWLEQYQQPDYARIDELIRATCQLIEQPEDLTRLVYEVGVGFAKQNIQYAEMTINPLLFVGDGFTFEQFLNAINDGRRRVERAWKVGMTWILGIARNEFHQADDVLRWASSPPATKGGVVGIALLDFPGGQPLSEFERFFRTAEKKELGRVVFLSSDDRVASILEQVNPDRIATGSGVGISFDAIRLLTDRQVPVNACVTRDIRSGRLSDPAGGALRHLYDDGIVLSLGSEMPWLYRSTLTGELATAMEAYGFSILEVEELVLNAARSSLRDEEGKQALIEALREGWQRLKTEHHELA
jgi:adenosine deaminase